MPAHEGPTPHYVTELWRYSFPISASEQIKLTKDLSRIKPFHIQAKENLTGNAKELWIAGIRDIQIQRQDLLDITPQIETTANTSLIETHLQAIHSTEQFIEWLQQQSATKTGHSGLGIKQYSWYQKHVHLLSMTWEDEERLLRRELNRAWSSLKLEEQRNIGLPPLTSVKNSEEYDRLANRSAEFFLRFWMKKISSLLLIILNPRFTRDWVNTYQKSLVTFFTSVHTLIPPLYIRIFIIGLNWLSWRIIPTQEPSEKMHCCIIFLIVETKALLRQ